MGFILFRNNLNEFQGFLDFTSVGNGSNTAKLFRDLRQGGQMTD
jgi:hypothetical protein